MRSTNSIPHGRYHLPPECVNVSDNSDQQTLSTVTEGLHQGPERESWNSNGPQPLSGRTKETLTLLRAYHTLLVCENRALSKTIVVLHGLSGSGKTSLVDTLREPVACSHGYFVAGKFFQPTMDVTQEPHSAIMAAFSDLCDLVLQSSDFDNETRVNIQKALGADANLLVRAISNLSPFLDGDSQFGRVDTHDARVLAKFKLACMHFLNVMSSARHPVVLFLDDIQWMDEGSRQLIETMLDDNKLENIMLVFAYRDEEADSIGDLFSKTKNVIDISVGNLDKTDVRQMISARLGTINPQVSALSDLTYSRTMGNAFHVIQFMEAIEKEGLLMWDKKKSSWIFDVDRIQRDMNVSETLLALLSRRIGHMSVAMQEVLKIASLMGFCFSEDILVQVASFALEEKGLLRATSGLSDGSLTSTSGEVVQSLITDAIAEGFIEKIKEGYQFTHDKLQASFQSLVERSEKYKLHYLIGSQYVSYDQDEDYMCHAAVHLNSGDEYTRAREHCVKLAGIYLEAARRSQAKSAFENAAAFLRLGLRLLDEEGQYEKWTRHFDLALEMTETLAKLELIVGNLAACRQMNQEVLLRCKSADTKINALVTEVNARVAANEVDQTAISSMRVLQELGIPMPNRVTRFKLLLKLRKVRVLFAIKADADILNLPLMQDTKSKMAVKLLVDTCTSNFMRDKEIAACYAALLATELTMRDGLSPYSANAFVVYGMVEILLGNLDRGLRFGTISRALTNRMPCKDADSLTNSINVTSVLHWKMSIREINPVLCEAMNSAFDVGNVVYATLSVGHICFTRYTLGENLGALEAFVQECNTRISKLSKGIMFRFAQPSMQFVINMRSSARCWKDITILSGDIMDENEYMRKAISTKNRIWMMVLWTYKSLLAFHFGYFEMAASIYLKMQSSARVYQCSFAGPNFYFHGALIFFERYRATRRGRYLRLVRKHKKNLLRFEAAGSPNVSEFLIFLKAEELSLKSKDAGEVVATYTAAIDAVKKAALCSPGSFGERKIEHCSVLAGVSRHGRNLSRASVGTLQWALGRHAPSMNGFWRSAISCVPLVPAAGL